MGGGLCRTCYNRQRPPKSKLQRRAYDHHVTVERIGELLAGGCGICGIRERLHIDHDHTCCPRSKYGRGGASCGRCIRGVLCEDCNLGLGRFRDGPALLDAAIVYLARNR